MEVGKHEGPIFSRLWTKDYEIVEKLGLLVVSKLLSDCLHNVSLPRHSLSSLEIVEKRLQKREF